MHQGGLLISNQETALNTVALENSHPSNQERDTVAAATMALFAGLYAGLSIFYFYEDFFRFIGDGTNHFMTDRSGVSVHVEGTLWSVLSPWRIAISALTLVLLSASAISIHRRLRLGKPLALFTLWGVLLPQVFWYTEFSVDWFAGNGFVSIMLAAPLIVLLPTALLYDGKKTLGSWSPSCKSPSRVLGSAIALAWIGFFATECLDHSYQMAGDASYTGALLAIGFAALGCYGLLRMRAWALLVGTLACGAFAMIPLGFEKSQYLASGGYIDSTVASATGSCLAVVATAALPLVAVCLIAGPYMREFVRRMVRD